MALETPTRTTDLTADVEQLMDFAEPEGVYRNTTECGGAFLVLGLLLLSPPPPRPKKDVR